MVTSVLRHRRSGRAGWAAAAVIAVALVIGGGTAGYLRLSGNDGCTGDPVRLTVAASPDQFPIMSKLAQQWSSGNRTVDGHCASVNVRPAAASAIAAALGPSWDTRRDGERPDVWAPDSSAWLLVAGSRPDAQAVLPTGAPPSLATSPVVLAMQRPMAQALGWPKREIGWTDLLGAFGRGQTWAQFGHPEWGTLRLGISDPTKSTAGLVSVLTILDPDNDSTMSNTELFGGLAVSQLVTAAAEDSEGLVRPYTETDAAKAASTLPAAFPILERDLAEYAAGKPTVDLVPVYPREGSTFADYPYTVLRAPWVDKNRQQVAADFLDYLQSDTGKKAYAVEGFRDPSRSTQDTKLVDPNRGFQLEVAGPQRAPTAAGLTAEMAMWNQLQKPINALLALDVSGSMNDVVPGTKQTRMQLIQGAAIQGAALLNNQTTIGLWAFSSKLTRNADYRELVPPGLAGQKIGGVVRRQAIMGAVQQLKAGGGTGLYDTVYAAYLRMQQAWQPNAQNVLVVMTDGKNEDDQGLNLAALLQRLGGAARADRPLPIIGIAVGPEADANALQQISRTTGGRTFVARDDLSAIQQIVLAFAGRIS
jgi:Ca-activated chloride channel homolog